MDLALYEQFPTATILQSQGVSTVFRAHRTYLAMGTDTSYFISSFGKAPSALSPMPSDHPYFHSPDRIYWYSHRECWSTGFQSKNYSEIANLIPGMEICVLDPGSENCQFVGHASLVSFGNTDSSGDGLLVSFTMVPRLSREVWVSCGGYSSWLLMIGNDEFEIERFDVAEDLLEKHWGRTAPNLQLTRYEGDVLRAAVNDKNEAVVTYQRELGLGEVFSGRLDEKSPIVRFGQSNSEDWYVPASCVISRFEAMRIVRFFMTTGRPIGLAGIE
jgi:hypothetical protein